MNGYDENAFDALPDSVTDLFGEEATAERAYDLLTVDVPTASWIAALEIARDKLGLTFFDWLSAVDEPGVGFRVCAHVASVGPGAVRRLLLRTTVPHAAASLPSAVEVYAGAAWHERETYEMFGVTFTDHPHLVHLLLPENFEGHPLRKDFVLAARVAKAWPGAKEPGEAHDPGAPKRRQMLPPGVPDPNEWGPLKGQLPPAPTRADRPVRRTRTAGAAGPAGTAAAEPGPPDAAPAPRRARSASAGSASQRAEPAPDAVGPGEGAPAPTRRARSASGGSASQRAQAPAPPPAGPRRARSAGGGSASQREAAPDATRPPAPAAPRTRGSDAPWHHARPAFDDGSGTSAPEPPPAEAEAKAEGKAKAEGEPENPAPDAPDHDAPSDRPDSDNNPAGGDSA